MKPITNYIYEHIIKGHLKKQQYNVYKSIMDSSKDLHAVILTDKYQIKQFIDKFKPVKPNIYLESHAGVVIYPVGDEIKYMPLFRGIYNEFDKWFKYVDNIKSLDDISINYFKKHGWY